MLTCWTTLHEDSLAVMRHDLLAVRFLGPLGGSSLMDLRCVAEVDDETWPSLKLVVRVSAVESRTQVAKV
jgi:hypothetical protein